MTLEEYLLITLANECNKVQRVCLQTLFFGPADSLDYLCSIEELFSALTDLKAVVEMLEIAEILPIKPDAVALKRKKQDVLEKIPPGMYSTRYYKEKILK